MAFTNVNINIDSELRDQAQSVFEALGIDLSTAVDMLLRQAIYQQEAPSFEGHSVKAPGNDKKDRSAAFGCLKGKIHVPDNFNEPLDDFKEYMQ